MIGKLVETLLREEVTFQFEAEDSMKEENNVPPWEQAGEISLFWVRSTFCSKQAFNWFSDAHPDEGAQSALLILPI